MFRATSRAYLRGGKPFINSGQVGQLIEWWQIEVPLDRVTRLVGAGVRLFASNSRFGKVQSWPPFH